MNDKEPTNQPTNQPTKDNQNKIRQRSKALDWKRKSCKRNTKRNENPAEHNQAWKSAWKCGEIGLGNTSEWRPHYGGELAGLGTHLWREKWGLTNPEATPLEIEAGEGREREDTSKQVQSKSKLLTGIGGPCCATSRPDTRDYLQKETLY